MKHPISTILMILAFVLPFGIINADTLHRQIHHPRESTTEIPEGIRITVTPQKNSPYLSDVKIVLSGEVAAKFEQGACTLTTDRYEREGSWKDSNDRREFLSALSIKPFFTANGENFETEIVYRTEDIHQLKFWFSFEEYRIGSVETWAKRSQLWKSQTEEAKQSAKTQPIQLIGVLFNEFGKD